MKENGKVSIIIPVYNGCEYIDRCLKSIIGQTYKNIQILLIVGKSMDLSLEKCIEWQKKDERIVILSRKDNGLGDARNFGLKIADGEFVSYVDIDDYVDRDFIELLIKPFENNLGLEISCCGFDKYFEDGAMTEGWNPSLSGEVSMNFDKYNSIVQYGVVWNKMYRRKFLIEKELFMFDGCHEDDALHFMIATQVRKAHFIQKSLYHYNIDNEDSLYRNKNNRKYYFKAMKFMINYIQRKHIFSEYYHSIRTLIVQRSEELLDTQKIDKEILTEYEIFLEEIFPEVLEEMKFKKDKCVEIKAQVVLFGGGKDGLRLVDEIGKQKINSIIDNNPKLKGTYVNDIPIITLNEFIKAKIECTLVISSSKYFYEIAKQLRDNNIVNYMTPSEFFILDLEIKRKQNNFILMNTPEHTNIGDHAIAESEKLFLKTNFSDYGILEITDRMIIKQRDLIKKIIKPNDIIIITGGGYLGSLWMFGGELSVRNIIQDYPLNKKIIFPQSMYYEENKYGQTEMKISEKIYRESKNLTIFVREEKSYEVAKQILKNNVNFYLVPDIVLSLKAYKGKGNMRNSVGICLKGCKESILSETEKKYIEKKVFESGLEPIKTTMHNNSGFFPVQREKIVENKLQELQNYKLVITDTLHCMIFCAITGTPCIAINNISKKIEGVYKWIQDLPYIKFISSTEEFSENLKSILELCKLENNNFFNFNFKKYGDKIIEVIKEEL